MNVVRCNFGGVRSCQLTSFKRWSANFVARSAQPSIFDGCNILVSAILAVMPRQTYRVAPARPHRAWLCCDPRGRDLVAFNAG